MGYVSDCAHIDRCLSAHDLERQRRQFSNILSEVFQFKSFWLLYSSARFFLVKVLLDSQCSAWPSYSSYWLDSPLDCSWLLFSSCLFLNWTENAFFFKKIPFKIIPKIRKKRAKRKTWVIYRQLSEYMLRISSTSMYTCMQMKRLAKKEETKIIVNDYMILYLVRLLRWCWILLICY